MKVRDLADWLLEFPDQEADVQVTHYPMEENELKKLTFIVVKHRCNKKTVESI